uniref:Uncharacterized protein n=1 Tax=Anguilla anguilla TaxID=7936 RepID=A0A0E9SL37_ANGAN
MLHLNDSALCGFAFCIFMAESKASGRCGVPHTVLMKPAVWSKAFQSLEVFFCVLYGFFMYF